MRNMLAITVLIFGLAGGVLAQDQPSTPDAALTADTQSTDNNKEHKGAPQNPDSKAEESSASQKKDLRPDGKNTQAPDQAPQNVIEYGG
jgi:hypothetical protein